MQLGKIGSKLVRLRPLLADDALPGWCSPAKSLGMKPLWHRGDDDLRSASGKLLDRAGLGEYLRCAGDGDRSGEPSPEHVHELRHLLTWESRTGIGVNPDSLTASEGQIYSARFLRLRPGVCFVGEVELPDSAPPLSSLFPQALVLPWGGEGRRVAIELDSPEGEPRGIDWPKLSAAEVGENLLTVLLTPGIYHSRDLQQRPLWKPSDNGGLIAASVGRPLAISGWDLAGNAAERRASARARLSNSESLDGDFAPGRPRPTRFAAPAGSVYFWHRSRTKAASPPDLFPPHCDKPRDHDLGWGVALCGTWKPCTLD
jgi:CRISPR-associated protein Cmr3